MKVTWTAESQKIVKKKIENLPNSIINIKNHGTKGLVVIEPVYYIYCQEKSVKKKLEESWNHAGEPPHDGP